MTLLLEDLALITAKTLEHYNERADEFWVGTRDHDVTQNIEALLRHIRGAPPLRILDLGCGPGRDLAAFRALGHEPIGLEDSPTAVAALYSAVRSSPRSPRKPLRAKHRFADGPNPAEAPRPRDEGGLYATVIED